MTMLGSTTSCTSIRDHVSKDNMKQFWKLLILETSSKELHGDFDFFRSSWTMSNKETVTIKKSFLETSSFKSAVAAKTNKTGADPGLSRGEGHHERQRRELSGGHALPETFENLCL